MKLSAGWAEQQPIPAQDQISELEDAAETMSRVHGAGPRNRHRKCQRRLSNGVGVRRRERTSTWSSRGRTENRRESLTPRGNGEDFQALIEDANVRSGCVINPKQGIFKKPNAWTHGSDAE